MYLITWLKLCQDLFIRLLSIYNALCIQPQPIMSAGRDMNNVFSGPSALCGFLDPEKHSTCTYLHFQPA